MNWHILNRLSCQSKKAGLPPGTVVHVGEKTIEKASVSCISYNRDCIVEHGDIEQDKLSEIVKRDTINWINVNGLHDVAMIQSIGEQFGIHHLVLEDIVNTGQRPKSEDYDGYLFVVLKMLSYDHTNRNIKSEQISIILKDNIVITFQERPGDVFDPIRSRIRNDKGRIRRLKADYMTYCLLDAIIDSYYSILETEAELIENLEDQVFYNPQPAIVHQIHGLKGDLLMLRKANWAAREMLSSLAKSKTAFFNETTMPYMFDVFDHSNGVADTVDTFREMLSSLLDLYLSSISHKMNSVMKVLTIIATIFIPLTFIAGIYGMNFENMPELGWKWGYPAVWATMAVMALSMLLLFKKNKWF